MLRRLQPLLAVLAIALVSMGALAQSENPFLGTWDIDFNESDFGGATVPDGMARIYADIGDGYYMYIVATRTAAGVLNGTSARYSYSGEQYPIATAAQTQAARISYRRINETTVEYTVRVGGEVSQIGAKFIAPNYQRLTIAIQYPNSDQQDQILVFNRR